MFEQEQEYFKKLLSSIELKEKLMDGILYMPPKNDKSDLSIIQDYDTWILKVNSLCKKITISLNEAIKFAIKVEDFNPFREKSNDEFLSQYFIENALYRLASLWDVLAQMSNIYFGCALNSKKIGYKVFFIDYKNIHTCNNGRTQEYESFKKDVKKYLTQIDDTNRNGEWFGNHEYVSNHLRNPLVHREDPHETSVLECEINLSDPLLFELKRIIEDYYKVNEFIDKLYKKIKLDSEVKLVKILGRTI